MNIDPWFLQIPLALVFALSGLSKLLLPHDRLAGLFVWVSDFRLPAVRAIGALELLGAVGLVGPAATGILPWLTPLAAVGLVGLMVGALATTLRHRLYRDAAVNVALMSLAAVVAYSAL
jgi:uncharacterized membrane protein YphA (DoxX/SURF4 family)